jgi:hypothetical protein
MSSVTMPLSDRTPDIAGRIQMIADLACALAKACAFSRDAQWFWRLAEAEVEQYCRVVEPTALRRLNASRASA